MADMKTQKFILRKILKEIREQSNIRQLDLATQLKRPQSFVSKYESGEKTLTFLEVREVCNVLGLSLYELIDLLEKEINESKPKISQKP